MGSVTIVGNLSRVYFDWASREQKQGNQNRKSEQRKSLNESQKEFKSEKRQSKYLSAGKRERPNCDAVQFCILLVEKLAHAFLINHRAEQGKLAKSSLISDTQWKIARYF